MRILGKTVIGFFFSLFFIVFLFLTSIYFQILNTSFLFYIFETREVYEKIPKLLAVSLPNDPNLSKEEQREYSHIAQQISPEFVKNVVETNFTYFLDFIKGENTNLAISVPGLEPGQAGIKWSLWQNPELSQQLSKYYGTSKKILIAWFTIFFILVGLFFLYGKLSNNRFLDGSILLITSGGFTTVLSIIATFFLIIISRELLNGIEPSQKILGLLSSSLFSAVTITWAIIAGILCVLGIVLKVMEKRK